MTDRTFAKWVEPIAAVISVGADAVLAFIRSMPAEFWQRPSPVEGWTQHDILAHLAGGNDQMVQHVLRAVIGGAEVAPATLDPDTDGENARGVDARREKSMWELIEEFARSKEEMLDLPGAPTNEHEVIHQAGSKYSVGDLMRFVSAEHDREHLLQIKVGSH
jgi:uncharacterized protein (TIGR03083 family)